MFVFYSMLFNHFFNTTQYKNRTYLMQKIVLFLLLLLAAPKVLMAAGAGGSSGSVSQASEPRQNNLILSLMIKCLKVVNDTGTSVGHLCTVPRISPTTREIGTCGLLINSPSITLLERHILTHFPPDHNAQHFFCKICRKGFKYACELKKHETKMICSESTTKKYKPRTTKSLLSHEEIKHIEASCEKIVTRMSNKDVSNIMKTITQESLRVPSPGPITKKRGHPATNTLEVDDDNADGNLVLPETRRPGKKQKDDDNDNASTGVAAPSCGGGGAGGSCEGVACAAKPAKLDDGRPPALTSGAGWQSLPPKTRATGTTTPGHNALDDLLASHPYLTRNLSLDLKNHGYPTGLTASTITNLEDEDDEAERQSSSDESDESDEEWRPGDK